MKSPFFPFPPNELRTFFFINLSIIQQISFQCFFKIFVWAPAACGRDLSENFHPLREDLLGDEVEREDVLGEGKVDLEDLLLHSHALLGLVRHQLDQDAVDLGQQEVHGIPQGNPLLLLLVLVRLDELIQA